jgi:hypothetical protein
MKKLLALAVLSVMALAAMGAGYALWSTTITIDGEVHTGNIDVAWSLDGAPWDTEIVGKDVSSIDCQIVGDILTVTLINAYPSIDYYCPINVHSTGSLPVHLGPVEFDLSGMPVLDVVYDPPQIVEIDVDWTGEQLHNGEFVLGQLHVHLDNNAEQNEWYTFTADLTAYQWNESPF